MEFKELIENLKKRDYSVEHFSNSKDAVAFLKDSIKGKSVGFGGSVTLSQLNIGSELEEENIICYHGGPIKAGKGLTPNDGLNENNTQVYMCSVNAISMQGEIVNIDGTGNRVASTAYGHEELYYIVGKNKIAKDLPEAIFRARNVAAPLNAKRLHRKTPCAVNADKCYDCNSPERICNGIFIQERPMGRRKTTVILINEELGY